MGDLPSRATLESLHRFYPAGTRVALVSMDDPYTKIQSGEQGSVIFVDDIGTIHIQWDCGSTLGAVYGEDIIRRI